jgi:hypothetical protein
MLYQSMDVVLEDEEETEEELLRPDTAKVLDDWLATVGLSFNPFQEMFFDAGADPHLPYYLVGHQDFDKLWGDWPSFLFAPAGGGKSAFRVRLAYACRAGLDGRRIFPVLYKPRYLGGTVSLEQHCHDLSHQAALEFLLELVYEPWHYLEQSTEIQRQSRAWLRANLRRDLADYLDRLAGETTLAGKLAVMADMADPTAAMLPSRATLKQVEQLCAHLAQSAGPEPDYGNKTARFRAFTHFLRDAYDYDATYILVDGVDAYYQTYHHPAEAQGLIRDLIDNIDSWQAERIFLKFFLHEELFIFLSQSLPKYDNYIKIEWTQETLVSMLQERLRVASEGDFASFDAISHPNLFDIEQRLVEQLRAPLPREALVLAARLLVAHVQRAGTIGKLSREDLHSAITYYHNHPV